MSVRRAPIVSVPTTCPSPRCLADIGRQCRALATAVTCVLGIAGILTVTIAGPAWAQGGGGAAGPGPTGSQGAAGTVVRDGGAGGPPRAGGSAQTVETMRSDLRKLVSANEVFHAKSGRYSNSIGPLSGYHPSPGVTVSITNASANGWSAEARAESLAGKSCVIYVGSVPSIPRTAADGRPASEAVAVCDHP